MRKTEEKTKKKKSGRKTSICRKCDINCATRGITYDTNYDATPEFGPFFCRISAVITVVKLAISNSKRLLLVKCTLQIWCLYRELCIKIDYFKTLAFTGNKQNRRFYYIPSANKIDDCGNS